MYGNNGPRYVLAFSVDLVASVGTIFFALLTRWYLMRQNKKIEDGRAMGATGPTQVQIEGGFRYQL